MSNANKYNAEKIAESHEIGMYNRSFWLCFSVCSLNSQRNIKA